MLGMSDLGRRGRTELSDVSFGEWLDQHDQPASLVRKFYDPIIISGLNEETRAASAEAAIHIFQDALLANSGGYLFGLPSCPLGRLYAKVPCRDVRLGARVAALDFDAGRVHGVTLQSGGTIAADAVVLATNYHVVRKWVPDEIAKRDMRFRGLDQLQGVPILGVHLWFDRPVMRESHAALIEGPLQWLFRKDEAGTALHGVISAARDFVGREKDELLPLFEAQVRRTLPDARDARLLRGVIVIEKRATFSPLPGVERLRPDQSPPPNGIQNLFLAGDYTKSGWPATMEGAVRSGYRAADAILRSPSLSRAATILARRSYLVDDLPIQWPAKLLGLSG
jgi:uncharacterized protein with NAD-binding domain and iron-sulfur cluster